MFERVRELSERYGVSIHTHTSEHKEEVDAVVELFGARPVEVFAQRGILQQGSLLAHCVWLDEGEIELLATTGTGVAHCPTSNMKLAGGAAPLAAFAAAGVNVGLGSDGAISNNSLSMWEAMKMASLLQKVTRYDATAVGASAALRMATIDGARALGIDDHVGSLEVGKQADVVTVDLWQPHLLPTVRSEGHDPVLWNLVFAARASDVRDVWVHGHHRVADGRLTGIDEAAALEEIHARTQSLLTRREATRPVAMLATGER
jgi:5-methylthioadenosine/S-adenosylhomocysteine deaminase